MIDYRVYLVTDDPSRYRGNWLENIESAIAGGVTCVQYRDTENILAVQYLRLRELKDLLRPRKIPLIINNEVDLAAAVRADGVHVGQGDMPPAAARRIVGDNCEIGLSITDLSQVDALRRLPKGLVNVIGIGPVYNARATKADAAEEMGISGLKAIVEATPDFRNVAIGGITVERASEVLAAGAQGLAVVSALSQVEDSQSVAAAFRRLFP